MSTPIEPLDTAPTRYVRAVRTWLSMDHLALFLAIVATVAFTWVLTSWEPPATTFDLTIGEPSPRDFFAVSSATITDDLATQAARTAAAAQVSDVYDHLPQADESATSFVENFFVAATQARQPIERTAFDAEGEPFTEMVTPSLDAQVETISQQYPTLPTLTITTLISDDKTDQLRRPALEMLSITLTPGVLTEELDNTKNTLITSPPPVILPLGLADPDAVRTELATMVAGGLQANTLFNEQATEQSRQDAIDETPPVTRDVLEGELIVAQGRPLTQLDIDTINEQGLNTISETSTPWATAALVTVVVFLIFAFSILAVPAILMSPRKMILVLFIVVMIATSFRVAIGLASFNPAWGYLIPTAGLAALASILLGPRFATIQLIGVAALAMVIGIPAGPTMFAILSFAAVIPLASRWVTQAGLRRLSLVIVLLSVALVGLTVWNFANVDVVTWEYPAAGLAAAVVSVVLLTGIIPFAGPLFGITTNLAYLDLTDRNHPALKHLETNARGTLNHSMMVGQIADAAAIAIGANNLLARAGGYYHDLGKTKAPSYFIENQFANQNPHDTLEPQQSVAAIRAHVPDGIDLSTKFKLPPEIRQIIHEHHGTSLLRYFWNQHAAQQAEAGLDVSTLDDTQFRHLNAKPSFPESAIVMMADSCEAAVRALAGSGTVITPELLDEYITKIIAEKVEDGQLDDAGLTLGQIATIRSSLLDSLTSNYHERVTYPDFPSTSPTKALPAGEDPPSNTSPTEPVGPSDETTVSESDTDPDPEPDTDPDPEPGAEHRPITNA